MAVLEPRSRVARPRVAAKHEKAQQRRSRVAVVVGRLWWPKQNCVLHGGLVPTLLGAFNSTNWFKPLTDHGQPAAKRTGMVRPYCAVLEAFAQRRQRLAVVSLVADDDQSTSEA